MGGRPWLYILLQGYIYIPIVLWIAFIFIILLLPDSILGINKDYIFEKMRLPTLLLYFLQIFTAHIDTRLFQ